MMTLWETVCHTYRLGVNVINISKWLELYGRCRERREGGGR